MISDIVFQVLKDSLFTSLLIGILLILVPLLQKRYRAKWRYIAWFVIAVRLLIPIDFSLPQAPVNIELSEPSALAWVTPPSDERPYLQVDIPQKTEAAVTSDFDTSSTIPDEPVQSSIAITPLELAGGIWVIGVLMFLLFQICSYQIFLRKLKIAHVEEVPKSFKETVWQVGVDMGICKLPEPVVTDIIDAPVLIGVLHPRILLPHTQYTDEALAFILRHELVHYRRRDIWYKLLLLLANAIHWFNPLVYLMTIQATKDIELACDDDVIRELDRDTRAKYGDTILSALPGKRRLEPVFSTHFGSTKKNMKGRLSNLFDMAAKRRGIVALCVLTVCTLSVTGLVTFGYAASPSVHGKEILHTAITIGPDNLTDVIDYKSGVKTPSTDKIPLVVSRTGYKILLNADVKGKSLWTVRLQSPDGKIVRNYTINEDGVQSGNSEWLTLSNFLQLVSGPAETGTWYLYVDSPGSSDTAAISARLIEPNVFSFTTDEQPEDMPIKEVNKDQIYDYYRTYDEAWNDIQAGYVFYMDKSFDQQAMPTVTGGSGSFVVHHNNTLRISISYKNLMQNTGLSATVLPSRIRFELISPSGEIAYSYDETQQGVEQPYSGESIVAITPGEWKYNIEFAYLTNGVDTSNLKVTAKYENIYQDDIQWLLNNKLSNGILAGYAIQSATTSPAKEIAFIWPTDGGSISTSFKEYPGHTGVDIARKQGTDIYAAAPGIVTAVKTQNTGYGKHAIIDHDGGYQTVYAHCDTLLAQVGDEVISGQKIATVGRSGNAKEYELHFEVRINGGLLNPAEYISPTQDVSVNLTQTKPTVPSNGNPYFSIKSSGGKSAISSGSFQAKTGQTLTIDVNSSIKGGSVDLFLFSPSGNEQRFTFGGSNKTETVKLSAGTWAYNCTGFFDSGEIVITGTISETAYVGIQSSQTSTPDTEKYDAEAIRIMDNSGTWGDSINRLLPSMSPSGVKKVVDIYLERHLFPGITPPNAARQVASTIEPAMKYMTKKDQESVNSIIAAYY